MGTVPVIAQERGEHDSLRGPLGVSSHNPSIHNEQLGPVRGEAAVGLHAVAHLVTHSRMKNLHAAVLQLCVKFALQAKEHVTLFAPVIRQVAWRVVHESDANIAELSGAPVRYTVCSFMLCRYYGCPVGSLKRNIRDMHIPFIVASSRVMLSCLYSFGSRYPAAS